LIKRWQNEGLVPGELSQSAPRPVAGHDAVAETASRYGAEAGAVTPAPTPAPRTRRWSLSAVRERLAFRPDTEHEQGLIRLGIALGLPVYLLFALRYDSVASAAPHDTAWMFLTAWSAFIVITIALLARIVLSPPRPSPARRLVAMATDFGGTAMFMSILGEFGALAYPVCVWAVLGHGVRYGTPYLVLAACLAIGGFSVVLAINPYWQANVGLGLSLLLGMLMLIVLIGTMLRHVHIDRERDTRARRAALALITPRLRVASKPSGDNPASNDARPADR
jgi:two-component system sensor histidine kinase RpfC